jgi:hypothetical protein
MAYSYWLTLIALFALANGAQCELDDFERSPYPVLDPF